MAGPDDKPLLLLSRQGKGRVALLLSDQAWLWARGFEGGGPQTELLRRLAHWLMKEPDLEEEALLGSQAGRNLLIERRTMADEAAPVTVTKPSGASETVTLAEEAPGLWRGTLASSENGIHRLRDGKLTSTSALGEAGTRELEELIASDRKLAPLVAETRGGIVLAWQKPSEPAAAAHRQAGQRPNPGRRRLVGVAGEWRLSRTLHQRASIVRHAHRPCAASRTCKPDVVSRRSLALRADAFVVAVRRQDQPFRLA